jgi:hypothetical protein
MTSLPHVFFYCRTCFFTAARDLDLCRAVVCRVEHSRVEQLFVCTQKMKLLEKPVKPIRAVSFFVSSSLFRQKSVEQTRVEQSQFEQFTMSLYRMAQFVIKMYSKLILITVLRKKKYLKGSLKNHDILRSPQHFGRI